MCSLWPIQSNRLWAFLHIKLAYVICYQVFCFISFFFYFFSVVYCMSKLLVWVNEWMYLCVCACLWCYYCCYLFRILYRFAHVSRSLFAYFICLPVVVVVIIFFRCGWFLSFLVHVNHTHTYAYHIRNCTYRRYLCTRIHISFMWCMHDVK